MKNSDDYPENEKLRYFIAKNLQGLSFSNQDFTSIKIFNKKLGLNSKIYHFFKDCDLTEANFSNVKNIQEALFINCNLHKANFMFTDAKESQFINCYGLAIFNDNKQKDLSLLINEKDKLSVLQKFKVRLCNLLGDSDKEKRDYDIVIRNNSLSN